MGDEFFSAPIFSWDTVVVSIECDKIVVDPWIIIYFFKLFIYIYIFKFSCLDDKLAVCIALKSDYHSISKKGKNPFKEFKNKL